MIPERRLQEETENQAKVPERRAHPRTRPAAGRFAFRLIVCFGVGLFAVSRFAAAAQAGYKVDALKGQLTVARAKEASLKGQLASLSAAQRLVAEASALKLSPAPAAMTVTVPGVAQKRTLAHHRRPSGFLAAIGAMIEAVAQEVAHM